MYLNTSNYWPKGRCTGRSGIGLITFVGGLALHAALPEYAGCPADMQLGVLAWRSDAILQLADFVGGFHGWQPWPVWISPVLAGTGTNRC